MRRASCNGIIARSRNSVAWTSSKMTPLLHPHGAFVPTDCNLRMREDTRSGRIRGRNKSNKPLSMRNRTTRHKLSRNAVFSTPLPRLILFQSAFSPPSPLFLSLSFSSRLTRYPRSLHQAPISRAYHFVCHSVGGRSNQSQSQSVTPTLFQVLEMSALISCCVR